MWFMIKDEAKTSNSKKAGKRREDAHFRHKEQNESLTERIKGQTTLSHST